MPLISILLVLILVFCANAQSPAIKNHFDSGTGYAKQGDHESALRHYLAALELSKVSPLSRELSARLHYNLGVCEYRLGRSDAAVSYLETALNLSSGSYVNAHYALGMAELSRENWSRARVAFLTEIKKKAYNAEAWFDLAFAYIGENNDQKAEAAFRKAIELNSVDAAVAHNNVGVLLARRGEFEEAAREFELAVRISSKPFREAEENLEFCRRIQTRNPLLAADMRLAKRA